jgi:hypothetical protein
MIETTIAKWHDFLAGLLPGGLDELLAEDCVFYSPVLFAPQRGRALTAMYLGAAVPLLSAGASGGSGRTFGYVKEVLSHPCAVLEFETRIGDTVINGVDIITCDDESRITEFKVMLRPLRAVEVVRQSMVEALAQLTSES